MNRRDSLGILAAVTYANFSQLGVRLVLSPLVPSIIATYHASKGDVGVVLTAMWAVFALQQYQGDVLSDSYGERRVLVTALGLATLASVAPATAPTFVVFGSAALALGAGAGLYVPAAVTLLDRPFEKTGQALGTHLAGGSVAGIVVPVVTSVVGSRYGWRSAVLVASAGAGVAYSWSAWQPAIPTSRGAGRRSLGSARP